MYLLQRGKGEKISILFHAHALNREALPLLYSKQHIKVVDSTLESPFWT